MNLSNFNPFEILRRRIGAVFAAFGASLMCCICGALMTFVFAPAQALQAARISGLPRVENAAAVQAVAAGDELLVTGVLTGNPVVFEDAGLVAYSEDEWQVTVPSSSNDDPGSSREPHGSWKSVKTDVPALTLEMNGQPVALQAAGGVTLSGPLHEQLVPGNGISAKYNGQSLPDGSRRYQGLRNGDQVTVLGKKAAGEGIAPDQLFAGDRAAFEENQRQAAAGLLIFGIVMMVMAPVVLVGGVLGAIFGRGRRR
jgi:hypothetical protein